MTKERYLNLVEYTEECLAEYKKTPEDVGCILALHDRNRFTMDWTDFVDTCHWIELCEKEDGCSCHSRTFVDLRRETADLIQTFKFVGDGWWLAQASLSGVPTWEFHEMPPSVGPAGSLTNLLNFHHSIQKPPKHLPYDPSAVYPNPNLLVAEEKV